LVLIGFIYEYFFLWKICTKHRRIILVVSNETSALVNEIAKFFIQKLAINVAFDIWWL